VDISYDQSPRWQKFAARQPSNAGSAKSALLLEADIGGGHVGFVPPTGDIACLLDIENPPTGAG
jgi:hypothetical protein